MTVAVFVQNGFQKVRVSQDCGIDSITIKLIFLLVCKRISNQIFKIKGKAFIIMQLYSYVLQAVLLALGLQHKGVDALTKELDLPATQVLALFNKTIRKLVNVSAVVL